jgi:hypothetical protein
LSTDWKESRPTIGEICIEEFNGVGLLEVAKQKWKYGGM